MLPDLAAFVRDHGPHGPLVGDAGEPGRHGYLVKVACPCGVTFERRVTELDGAEDLLQLELRCSPWRRVAAGVLVLISGHSLFDPLVALVIAGVILVTTIGAVVGSHQELMWPENVVCGHPEPKESSRTRIPLCCSCSPCAQRS